MSNIYTEKINNYLDSQKEEMVSFLGDLVSINSVKADALPGVPYGKGLANILSTALKKAESFGFETKNMENYIGFADFYHDKPYLGIIVHLDVVGIGSGWIYPPFELSVKDGKLYGRGTSDNKGATVASIFAIKAIKVLNIPLKKNIRLIFGCDEESGFSDLKYYIKNENLPEHTFVPDGDFPVINIEKGGYGSSFSAEFKENISSKRQIINIKGGYRGNVVPPEAKALIVGFSVKEIKNYSLRIQEKTGVDFIISEQVGGVLIRVHGLAAHASTPEKGKNALTALISFLCSIPFEKCDGFDALQGVNSIFPYGDYYGLKAGISYEDDISGKLTVNFAICEYTISGLLVHFDMRTPVSAKEEVVVNTLYKKLAVYNILLNKNGWRQPHHTPEDTTFIKKLLEVYGENTGFKPYCKYTGGGTYAHIIEGAVAFGARFEDTPKTAHMADEFIPERDLILSSKIFAHAIVELCQ